MSHYVSFVCLTMSLFQYSTHFWSECNTGPVDLIILFLWNIIFTFYYTRVRPQCDFSILGRRHTYERDLLRQKKPIETNWDNSESESLGGVFCMSRHTKETTEKYKRDHWDIWKRLLRHTKETIETYKRDHWDILKRPLRHTKETTEKYKRDHWDKHWTINPEP